MDIVKLQLLLSAINSYLSNTNEKYKELAWSTNEHNFTLQLPHNLITSTVFSSVEVHDIAKKVCKHLALKYDDNNFHPYGNMRYDFSLCIHNIPRLLTKAEVIQRVKETLSLKKITLADFKKLITLQEAENYQIHQNIGDGILRVNAANTIIYMVKCGVKLKVGDLSPNFLPIESIFNMEVCLNNMTELMQAIKKLNVARGFAESELHFQEQAEVISAARTIAQGYRDPASLFHPLPKELGVKIAAKTATHLPEEDAETIAENFFTKPT